MARIYQFGGWQPQNAGTTQIFLSDRTDERDRMLNPSDPFQLRMKSGIQPFGATRQMLRKALPLRATMDLYLLFLRNRRASPIVSIHSNPESDRITLQEPKQYSLQETSTGTGPKYIS